MTTSRTFGDRLNRRYGPVALARSGAALATIGLGVGLVVGSVPVGIAGFAAMGAGLGVVIPILFRAAASTPNVSASLGVAAVSTIGWLGFLAGPPAIGLAASVVGLRAALGIVVLATLTLTVLAGSAEPSRHSSDAQRSVRPAPRPGAAAQSDPGSLNPARRDLGRLRQVADDLGDVAGSRSRSAAGGRRRCRARGSRGSPRARAR